MFIQVEQRTPFLVSPPDPVHYFPSGLPSTAPCLQFSLSESPFPNPRSSHFPIYSLYPVSLSQTSLELQRLENQVCTPLHGFPGSP